MLADVRNLFLQGSIHTYEPGLVDSLKVVRDLHSGQFIAIGALPGNEHCVVSTIKWWLKLLHCDT